MRPLKTFLIAIPVAFGLLAAPAAHAEWRGQHGRDGGDHYQPRYQEGHRHGGSLAGALLGLGAAAVIGGIIASRQHYYQPPAFYEPQPEYYPSPAYDPRGGYYQSPGYGYQSPGYGYGYGYGHGSVPPAE